MPLRDHFRAPLDNRRSWDEVHGQWPAMIVQQLSPLLPEGYEAAPHVHLGSFCEIDVAAYEGEESPSGASSANHGATQAGPATALEAPPRPTRTIETDLQAQDQYEVRIYDAKRGRRLVAAIELVSPANKDRPEHRNTFVAKCHALLQQQVSVSIVDIVTVREFNLFAQLLTQIAPNEAPRGDLPPLYAVTCRSRGNLRAAANGRGNLLDIWENVLDVGQPLPRRLPLWLADDLMIGLDLEASYEDTCRVLRIHWQVGAVAGPDIFSRNCSFQNHRACHNRGTSWRRTFRSPVGDLAVLPIRSFPSQQILANWQKNASQMPATRTR